MGISAYHNVSRQLKNQRKKESGKPMHTKMIELKEYLGLLNDIELIRFSINHTWKDLILNKRGN